MGRISSTEKKLIYDDARLTTTAGPELPTREPGSVAVPPTTHEAATATAGAPAEARASACLIQIKESLI